MADVASPLPTKFLISPQTEGANTGNKAEPIATSAEGDCVLSHK
jgi:hypothetical protein